MHFWGTITIIFELCFALNHFPHQVWSSVCGPSPSRQAISASTGKMSFRGDLQNARLVCLLLFECGTSANVIWMQVCPARRRLADSSTLKSLKRVSCKWFKKSMYYFVKPSQHAFEISSRSAGSICSSSWSSQNEESMLSRREASNRCTLESLKHSNSANEHQTSDITFFPHHEAFSLRKLTLVKYHSLWEAEFQCSWMQFGVRSERGLHLMKYFWKAHQTPKLPFANRPRTYART